LYNTTGTNIDISGWSIQYCAAATLTQVTANNTCVLPEGTIINANDYFSIKFADGSGGEEWPEGTFDYEPTGGETDKILNFSGTAGKVFLMKSDVRVTPATIEDILGADNFGDYVPFGTGCNPVYGSNMAANLTNAQSALRKSTEGVYQYTGNIGNDFEAAIPNPRKSSADVEKVETPVISPAGGTVTEDVVVTITCATEGATIYYTTDGTTPTASSNEYSEPFTVSMSSVIGTATVKAFAVKEGLEDSEIASVTYTFTTGLNGIQDNAIEMFVSNGALNVISDGGMIEIFNVLGVKVVEVNANIGITTINGLPNNQMLIVKIGDKNGKVVVR